MSQLNVYKIPFARGDPKYQLKGKGSNLFKGTWTQLELKILNFIFSFLMINKGSCLTVCP